MQNLGSIRLKTMMAVVLCTVLATGVVAQFTSDDYASQPQPFSLVNDGSANFNPVIGDNGLDLWFTRTGHPNNTGGENDQDIWFMQYNDGRWSEPSNDFVGLNTKKNDLVVGQSENTLVYILRYNQNSNKELTSINAFKRIDGVYEHDHVIELPELNISGSYFGFYVSRDESFIIISMKGEFTFGKEDLYISLNREGAWTKPIHMGARINTAGFEMSPFVSSDGRHLFFSSEGHRSYGKGDIFVSTRLDDTWQNWSKPINLGPNINTPGFEAYFCLNETLNEAYFFSDRVDGNGRLYRIPHSIDPRTENMSPHQMASGFIKFNHLTPMQIKLNLMDNNDQVIQSITTNEDGYFNLQSFLPNRDYKLAFADEMKNQIGDAEIFLANDLGEKMVFMNEEELGMFAFKVISGNTMAGIDEFEDMARKGKVVDKPTTISGKVTSFGTIQDALTLNIVDEHNNLVKTVETDHEGFFTFSTDVMEKRYFLSIDKDRTGLVDVYEVYLTNDNPEEDIVVTKTDKHLFEFSSLLNAGNSPIKLMDERDYGIPERVFETYGLVHANNSELSGYLKRGALPLIDAEIELLDENEDVVGTVKTGQDGYFQFDTPIDEGEYELRLTKEQQDMLASSEIYLAKNPDDVLFYMNDDRAGVFAFKKLARSKPMTLYSLRKEAEGGAVVNEGTSLKGKFQYKKLPKNGVMLTLLDEDENVVQQIEVQKDGSFEFDQFTTDKNYFISADGEGLSDIYEIYISGQNKNVLVNRTNKFVFSFKVLPSQDVVLTEAFEKDDGMPQGNTAIGDGARTNISVDRAYHEFDLDMLKALDFEPLDQVISEARNDYQIVIRVYVELEDAPKDKDVALRTLSEKDIEPMVKHLEGHAIDRKNIEVRLSNSDQAIIVIQPAAAE
ncbi:MAG: PD40 domain-containing protein [Flavobacteriales bacterium]|nr:PD40 domain-containing protein [Flavobacteriales bacterium]